MHPRNKGNFRNFSKQILVDKVSYTDKKTGHSKTGEIYWAAKYIDSMNFERRSLDNLFSNLTGDQMKITKKYFPDEEKFRLMRKKGVYPYDYVNSPERMKETQLPPIDKFYSNLKEYDITQFRFDHAQKVWTTFECRTLKHYAELCCKSDVLQLADWFESFIDTLMDAYGLDPSYYVSDPASSWDAMLRDTDVTLTLLTDNDMHHFFERTVRGGVSITTKASVKTSRISYQSMSPRTQHSVLALHWTRPKTFTS